MPDISLLPGEGYGGDPVNARIKLINAIIAGITDSSKNGVATLANGTTSIVVTHGLGWTPVAGEIAVTPLEAWGAAVNFWVDTYTATQFTIHVNADPTQDVDFGWFAHQLNLI